MLSFLLNYQDIFLRIKGVSLHFHLSSLLNPDVFQVVIKFILLFVFLL